MVLVITRAVELSIFDRSTPVPGASTRGRSRRILRGWSGAGVQHSCLEQCIIWNGVLVGTFRSALFYIFSASIFIFNF